MSAELASDAVDGDAIEAPRQGSRLSALPSIGRLVDSAQGQALVAQYGHPNFVRAARIVVERWRGATPQRASSRIEIPNLIAEMEELLQSEARSSLRPVFNLTGAVLHTNLGRALLCEEAISAAIAVAREAASLEYDMDAGSRGDRDHHVERILCELTGAEAATIVNNNAAAVLLVLNTLARGKEVIVSRGELVEIGGSFRMPDVMSRAGVKLREVGATNRTHPGDYAQALSNRTALILRAHTSNFQIVGFTTSVPDRQVADIARQAGVPFVNDLGSGNLVDLRTFGLPGEPTVGHALEAGADLVTFSGDKLLGGPQAGLIVGRRDLVERLRRNPLKRALRCDKLTIACLRETLRLYRDPQNLPRRLPTLRLLTRPLGEIGELAARLAPIVAGAVEPRACVDVISCETQVGSGSLPGSLIPSAGLRISRAGSASFSATKQAAALRGLPRPVVGRIVKGAVVLDLRCLEDEAGFVAQLERLKAAVEP